MHKRQYPRSGDRLRRGQQTVKRTALTCWQAETEQRGQQAVKGTIKSGTHTGTLMSRDRERSAGSEQELESVMGQTRVNTHTLESRQRKGGQQVTKDKWGKALTAWQAETE